MSDNCLIEGCKNNAKARGLCKMCHQNARRAINRGDVTEEQLVELNMMRPSRRGKAKGETLFSKALVKKRIDYCDIVMRI